MKQQNGERSFKDPVCGMEVSRMTASEEFIYQSKPSTFVPGFAGRRSRRILKSIFDITASAG
jgi:hypothetical protein